MPQQPPRTYAPQTTRRTASTARAKSRPTGRRTKRPRSPADIRRTRRKLLLALYVAFVVEIIAILATSPLTGVKRVQVEGVESLPTGEAQTTLAALRLPPRVNWLRPPLDAMQTKLRALPWVQSAQVTRSLPNALTARIVLRLPALLVQTKDRRFECDAAGVAIREVDGLQRNLPLLVMRRITEAKPGDSLPAADIAAALRLYAGAEQTPVVRIAKIEVDQSDNLCLNMQDGVSVCLGNADSLPAKIAQLKNLYRSQPDIARTAEAVNLSCPEWPVYRPRPLLPSFEGMLPGLTQSQ